MIRSCAYGQRNGVVPAVSAVTVVPIKSNLRPQGSAERIRRKVPLRGAGQKFSGAAGQVDLAICTKIDTTKLVWANTPKHHKTSHKGKNRVIVIGPQGQQVLNAIREMSRSDFVFDPQVGFEEYVRKAFGDKAKARKVGACYTKHGLNTAVRNACDKAGIPRWSPGQLRKTRATQARRDGDLETARQILGHSSKQTTERHCADVDLSRAEANALQFG